MRVVDWIGEGLEELTIQQLSAAGQQVYSHAGRLSEMDRSGLPSSGKLSRATVLHIGQELDADYIVFGDLYVGRENGCGQCSSSSRQSGCAPSR